MSMLERKTNVINSNQNNQDILHDLPGIKLNTSNILTCLILQQSYTIGASEGTEALRLDDLPNPLIQYY